MGVHFPMGGGPYFTGEYGPPGQYSPIEYGPRVHIQGGGHIQYDTGRVCMAVDHFRLGADCRDHVDIADGRYPAQPRPPRGPYPN